MLAIILHIDQQTPLPHDLNHLYQQRHTQGGSRPSLGNWTGARKGPAESPPEDRGLYRVPRNRISLLVEGKRNLTNLGNSSGGLRLSCGYSSSTLHALGQKCDPHHPPPVHLSCQDPTSSSDPQPSATASTMSGGSALPIPVPGCHLLAEHGLAEIGPWWRLGLVCIRPGRREFEKQIVKSLFTS